MEENPAPNDKSVDTTKTTETSDSKAPVSPLEPITSPSQSPNSSFLEELRKKRKMIVAVVIVIGLTILAGGLFVYYQNPKTVFQDYFGSPSLSDIWQRESGRQPTGDEERFTIKGDKIFDGSEVLFTNVENVNEVRLGPDGKTIHFKVVGDNYQAHCANLESEIGTAFPGYPSPPPTSPPWDYKEINDFATIKGCDGHLPGGYLKNSDYFSYLKLIKGSDGFLIVENLASGDSIEIPVGSNLLEGFFDAEERRGNSYWVLGIEGKDGFIYHYPRVDSPPVNGKFVMAFGRLILAVDVDQQKLLGGVAMNAPDYSVVIDSFWFIASEGSPLVVVESGWEGYKRLEALLDLSEDILKIVKLNSYQESLPDISDIKTVQWEGERVLLTFYNQIDVTSEVDVDIEALNELPIEKIQEEEEKTKAELLQTGKYAKVFCSLEYGILTGCFAVVDLVSYSYTPGGSLIRI